MTSWRTDMENAPRVCLRWTRLWWDDSGPLKLFMIGLTLVGFGLIAHIITAAVEQGNFERGSVTLGGTYPECTLTVHQSALKRMAALGLLEWLEACEDRRTTTGDGP